jgi:hypothetical protein
MLPGRSIRSWYKLSGVKSGEVELTISIARMRDEKTAKVTAHTIIDYCRKNKCKWEGTHHISVNLRF